MRVDAVATYSHYWDHLREIHEALPGEIRGDVYLGPGIEYAGSKPLREARKSTNLALCAGIADTRRTKGAAILTEHGTNQSYGGESASGNNSAFAGGAGRSAVALFLSVNEHGAARDRARYPRARVEVIGSPYLAHLRATLPARTKPNPKPVIALSSHWPMGLSNEGISAWGEYHGAFAELAAMDDYEVIGHGHPRVIKSLAPHYKRMDVGTVYSFEDVLNRADCFVCDSSSAQYYSAAMGIPNVVLDSKWYRPWIDHGGRFWTDADIGPRISDPESLPAAVNTALTKRPWPGQAEILERVFPDVGDPVAVAVAAITETTTAYTPMPARR